MDSFSLDNNTTGSVQKKWITNPIPYFIFLWALINLVQVSFMELTSDEGYYWFYAQHLQWGYYDHPPMVALMIKAGNYLFGGELGVRFVNVLFSTIAILLFFKLLPPHLSKTKITWLLLLSAPLVHYLTFLVFPDGPLVIFSLLFLVVYKQFLEKEKFSTAILLGLSMALMAWSKYHGALVVLFTIISNPKLLKSGFFWLSLCIAFVLFSPHIWWQYQHNFPTFRYHLFGRTDGYSLHHVGEYLSQQIVAIGPGLLFIPFISKAKNMFERTLIFIAIGTMLFFLVSSFKTFVHFHWTSIAVFPGLYFAVQYYHQPKKKKLFAWLIVPFVLLFFALRILLAIPIIPNMHVGEDYYHGRKAWAKDIAMVAGNRPVFMPNNLREASLYSFYTGRMGVTLYNRPEKKSQYELWGYEDSLQGKEVLFVTRYPGSDGKPLTNSLQQSLYYSTIPKFQSYYTGIGIQGKILTINRDSIRASIEITNHRSVPLMLTPAIDGPILFYRIEKNKEGRQADVVSSFSLVNIMPLHSYKQTVSIPITNLQADSYILYLGLREAVLPEAILSSGEAFSF